MTMLRYVATQSFVKVGTRNGATSRRSIITSLHYAKSSTNKLINMRNPLLGAALALSTLSYSYCDAQVVAAPPSSSVLVHQAHRLSKVDKAKESYLKEMINKLEKFIRYCKRFLTYLLLGLPVAIVSPAAYLLRGVIPSAEEWGWDYMIWAIEKLGPTFIKLAQWASTRPDLYPPMLIEKLQRLQDGVSVKYSMDAVEKTLREAFGDDWKSKLSLDPKPLGAGCVAQVFKGILKTVDKNIDVAVKLIHPHVENIVATDMEILAWGASIIEKIPSLDVLQLGSVMREFGEMMSAQLDLRVEASNLKHFSKKFNDDAWAVFPKPIDGFINKNVLVETLMDGEPISKYMQRYRNDFTEKSTKLKLMLSDLGCRTMLKMIFFDNFIHGDLHPGNILVQFDKNGNPRLGILDCGIVYATRSEKDHEVLVQICLAFMKHDGIGAAKLMIDRANSNRPESVINADKFCAEVQQLIDDAETHSYFEHLGEYVTRICNLARVYNVPLDPAYFHIAMALAVVEGISLAFDKDLDLVSKCIPIIVKSKALRALGVNKFPILDEEEEKRLREQSRKIAESHKSK